MKNKKKIIAFVVTIVLLGFIFYKIDIDVLIATLKNFKIKYLVYIVPLYLFSLYLRGIRWKVLLCKDEIYSAYNLAKVFTVGSMLNSFLPARAGDIYRAYYLGKTYNTDKMSVFGSVIFERMFDGIAVFLFLLMSVLIYSHEAWIIKLTYLTGLIFLGGIFVVYIVFRYNLVELIKNKVELCCKDSQSKAVQKIRSMILKFSDFIDSFVDGFCMFKSGRRFVLTLILSILIWLLEVFVAYFVMISLNLHLGIFAAFFAISLTSFSTVIPSTSVFLGPYQYAYILALGLFAVTKSVALAVSALHQGILMLILVVFGGLYWLQFNLVDKEISK